MPKCVLIVDDDPAQRRILEETVKRFGFAARSAENGEHALDVLRDAGSGEISLLLLDLVMPGLDGMGVLDRLRGEPSAPPVIVQTANGSIESAISAMRAGATDFVVKPVNPERLQVSINNALRITQLETEIKRIKRASDGSLTFTDIITRSDSMARVIDLGRRAGQSNIPVL
ncbi:MAG: response regulator, partial [Pseudomonadota bacterium]|nr:response regulator [Pseudomonadota bacterium]